MRQVMVKLIGTGYGFTIKHKGVIVKATCSGYAVGKGASFYIVTVQDLHDAGVPDAYPINGDHNILFVGERNDNDRLGIQDFTYYCEVDEYRGKRGGENPRNYVSKAQRRKAKWEKRKAIKKARLSDWVTEELILW